MQIIEIYKSIQGESSFAGLPCVFVRLAICNLRCTWCDSEYTFKGGKKMTAGEVEAQVLQLSPRGGLVEFTGGEPMLHEREILPLMERLISKGYTVLLETSGERPLERVPFLVHKIVDVKCPGSGEAGKFRSENLYTLTERDELKFVLVDRTDYEFARDFVEKNMTGRDIGNIIFSPAFRKDANGARTSEHCLLDPQQLAAWILADNLPVRLGLQIHKFIWQPQVKGV
jgi:7-carboxy-7-deazaguanine synthase